MSFSFNNVDSINGRPMSPKSSAIAVVYSDASDTGFGGYSVQCGADLVAGLWPKQHMGSSSTLHFWRLNLSFFLC